MVILMTNAARETSHVCCFVKDFDENRSMSHHQNNCNYNAAHYSAQPICCHKTSWFYKYIKPLISFIFSVILALSMSHFCEKYSENVSFDSLKIELNRLRNNLNTLGNSLDSLQSEMKLVLDKENERINSIKEVKCKLQSLSESIFNLRSEVSEAVTVDNMKNFVATELQTYDADKTGKTDYALESSGGSIVCTRDTETYHLGLPTQSIFGIPICKQQHIPRIIIQKGVQPGECWAFKGSKGTVVIKLSASVIVSGITIEHIPQSISPNGDISSALKDFNLRGLTEVNDKNGCLLGEFTYDNVGSPVQYFQIENAHNQAFDMVELNIISNNGNKDYTCIYRVRVHGTLASR